MQTKEHIYTMSTRRYSCLATARAVAIAFAMFVPIPCVSSFQIRTCSSVPRTAMSRYSITSTSATTATTNAWCHIRKWNPVVDTRLMYKNKEFENDGEETNAKGIQARTTPTSTTATTAKTTTTTGSSSTVNEKPKISRVVNSSSSSSKDARKNVHVAKTLQEYQEKMKEYKDCLVVIRFYSHWCKSCKAVEPKYYRLARINPQVEFIDIAITKENQEEFTKEFNIKSVPFGHIVHPQGGLVEKLPMGKMYWEQFEDTLYTYVNGYCDVNTYI
mmetsp:Transcript_11709/g.21903  ORF Transcript_11709/g.21903 Transcript_11709/m.21903 type:complete len:273 (+) Transcript_11709:428-1246(+)